MSEEADLDAYLRRINYAGSIAPTLETLTMLHRLHPGAIPFETLDPLMDLPVRLGLRDIEQKLVHDRRGGNQVEHNLLFKAVLEAMDFPVTAVAAATLWARADTGEPPVDHLALVVDVNGSPYLADVGFAGPVATAPLRLRADLEQQTPIERFRLTGGYPKWRLDIEQPADWQPVYEFTASPLPDDAVTAINDQFVAAHRDTLLVRRADGQRRMSLHNRSLTVTDGENREESTAQSAGEILHILTQVFGIALPENERVDAALAKILRPTLATD